jgi:DNA (cytosine-5)-methyltransferase 1
VEEPLRTITGAHRGERGIVVPSLMSIDHQSATSANRAASDPLSTVTHKARHAIIVPTMVQTGYGEREGQAPRVPGQEKPLGTIVGSQKHALVSAFLAKNYTGVVGSDLAGPIHTITATDHHAVVASHLVRLKANGRQGQGLDEPIGSIQAQGNHWAQVEAFLVKYYGSGVDASLEEPLDTITGKPRFGLVVIHGVEYQIVDIGFRMLEPGELFKGQGFPDDYEHQHVIIDGEPVTLTKSDQVAACGNSVPPDFVRALVEANVPRYALRRRDEAVAA